MADEIFLRYHSSDMSNYERDVLINIFKVPQILKTELRANQVVD